MPSDLFGLPLTTRSQAAAAAYNQALQALFLDKAGVEEKLNEAIRLDSSFALPKALLARIKAVQRKTEESKAYLNSLSGTSELTERERSQVESLKLFVVGQTGEAVAAMELHLKNNPRDFLILTLLSNFIFFSGGMGKKERLLRLLEESQSQFGDHPLFLTRYSFHLQEVGDYERAEAMALTAMRVDPDNLFAIHSLAHIYQQGGQYERVEELVRGIDFQYYQSSFLCGHMHWHRSLAALPREGAQVAQQYYFEHLPSTSGLAVGHLEVADFTGLLWRIKMRGEAIQVPPEIKVKIEEIVRTEESSSRLLFSLVHCALYWGLEGNAEVLDRLQARLVSIYPEKESASCHLGLSVFRAIGAIAQNHFEEARQMLSTVTPGLLELMGGSNIERQVILEMKKWLRGQTA